MGKIEIWELHKSSSEYEAYEVSQDSSYDETDEESDYEDRYKSINLFDNNLNNKIYKDNSDLEERGLENIYSNENTDEEDIHFESDYSQKDDSEVDLYEYMNEWQKLQYVRAYGQIANDIYYNFDIVPRTWLSVFYISAVHNLENVPQNYFYSIKISHINPNANSSLKEIKVYTPLYSLKAGERYTLRVPIFLWKKKKLIIPYGEFKNYLVKIDMWKKHKLSLNTLHASQTLTFQEIIENKSNFTISLNMTVPKIIENGDKDNNIITEQSEKNIPIHKINVVMLLEEIFDFVFVFENWWFTQNPELPDNLSYLPKIIKISVQSEMSGDWVTKTAGPSYDDYWPSPGIFIFRGTLRQMKISYLTVKVYGISGKKFWNKTNILLGTCVMSLKSVKEYPLVRGIVKKLVVGTNNMQSGTIQGNIRCCVKSAGLTYIEDIKNRPSQPISGSALLTHLDKSCQYLVIRLLRCENLPATNTDTNSSDPVVKVKWDGIVNFTPTLESTTSPVYNQNMYFPIHLVDMRELINPSLIKYSLPIDLASKGPVIMEVWDSDDTSSEFLGGIEIPLSKLYTDGMLYSRSLVDGIYTEPSKQSLINEESLDPTELVSYSGFSNDVDVQYTTRLYADTLTLTGYTVPHRGNKPTITFEMYILPPMPNDLYIPNEQKRQIKSDTYRDLRRRWDNEFDLWQKMYKDQTLSNFPQRRFISTTTNNAIARDVFPSEIIVLSRFVTPIQVSSQLSHPGQLLHWISNIGLKDESVEKIGDLTKIETWQHPSRLLTTRRGGLHDRALLLCSCLLGLGYDAYVCKGTLNNGLVEHCWVMTRHSDSTVSFWESGNKKIWHLPKRWNLYNSDTNLFEDLNAPSAPLIDNYQQIIFEPTSNIDQFQPSNININGLTKYEMYGNDYVQDQKIDVDTLIHRQDEIDFDTSAITDNLNKMLYENPEKKHEYTTTLKQIKPKEELVIPFETLVYVPYSSIETVFNNKQLWGNIQNHHPSCIKYDLNEPTQWKPFLKVPLEDEFVSNIQITAPPSDNICTDTSKDIINDIGDMIEVMRAQRGLKCSISKDIQMHERLESFLDMLEFRESLDPQFDPGMPPHLLGWSNRKKLKNLMKIKKAEEMISEMGKSTQLKQDDSDLSTGISSDFSDNELLNQQAPKIEESKEYKKKKQKEEKEQEKLKKQKEKELKKEKKLKETDDKELEQNEKEENNENEQDIDQYINQNNEEDNKDTNLTNNNDNIENNDMDEENKTNLESLDNKDKNKTQEEYKNESTKSRRRRRRNNSRSNRRSKPLEKYKVDDPKHMNYIRYRFKRCSLNDKGFIINKKKNKIYSLKNINNIIKIINNKYIKNKIKIKDQINKTEDDKYKIKYKLKNLQKQNNLEKSFKTLDNISKNDLNILDFEICTKFVPNEIPSSPGISRTPMSDLSQTSIEKLQFNIQSEIIYSAIHRMKPPNQIRIPVSNKLRSSVDKRNVKLSNHLNQQIYRVKTKKGFIRTLLSKVKDIIPDSHKTPTFVDNMRQIIPMPEYYKDYMYPNYNIPYEFKVFESKEISKWYWYYNMEAMQYSWQKNLPVPANHTFIGIPIHFSTSDVNEIRNLLCCNKRFKKLLVNKVDDIIYVIYCKVYPLLGNLLSTWIFIGCHVPWRM